MSSTNETPFDHVFADNDPAEPLFVTATELAQLLRISTRTLWRLLSAHKIPEPIRLGGAVRWRMELVQDWIEKGCPAQNK